jgi:membrane associated rhomboid family serine protease
MIDDTDDTPTPDWDSLAWVGNYTTSRDAHEHGLVILAMRHAYWVNPLENETSFSLWAEPEHMPAIRREIASYDEEQLHPAPRMVDESDVFHHQPGWLLYAAWMATLVLVFLWQHSTPGISERFASSSTGLISRGEWWRPFTALFLHADASHLIGNLLSGLLFSTLVSRSIGATRGWVLILASGTVGNALTSTIAWPESFSSIGASTAVFGALGILSGIGFSAMLRAKLHLSWARTAAPVIAGVVLLGWLGGGSEGGNTDVLGHVFGFSSGLASGCLTGSFSSSTADASTAGNARAARGASP